LGEPDKGASVFFLNETFRLRCGFITYREVGVLKLYRATLGNILENNGEFFVIENSTWDELVAAPDLHARLVNAKGAKIGRPSDDCFLAPSISQEVWAAGVTYYRSRDARIAESKDTGGGSFYDRVYSAERPELFFKSLGSKVVGPSGKVRIRSDAQWSVPEPELALLISSAGSITGYTIGNDVSSRDIEGENPLYLPQAKVYDGSCALGPCILVMDGPLPSSTSLQLTIFRHGGPVFVGSTTLESLKRRPQDLVDFLCRENSFPHGAFLITGTGVVPDDDFTLMHHDLVKIDIEGIGSLENYIE
jgi:2-dehydro-3-deoxy-D-arabinonate dehydratase